MPDRKWSPDDLLTARQIATDYGIDQRVAESLMRQRGREGKLVYIEGFRRRFIRREDVGVQASGEAS
jgi:hypothetical protein